MNNPVDGVGVLLPWLILIFKVGAAGFVLGVILVWQAARFMRVKAYGPGGGRK